MDNVSLLHQIEPIVSQYGVKIHFLESFGRITRIYGDKGVFALKKITPQQGTDFFRNIQMLYQKGYNRIVPIYPTLDGRYAVLQNQSLYYLMPWLPNEEKEDRNARNQQLFRELARLHTLSLKEVSIDPKEKEEHYQGIYSLWEKETEFIEGYIDTCERVTYMAPTQLLFCLYFNDILQALNYSKRKLKDWFEKTKDETKARAVTIHGKISSEHFLYDERGYGYFINLEDSRQGAPIHDLLPFLSRLLNTFPKRCDECVDWLYVYFKFFPLKEEELQLLLSYFAHPGPVLRVVEEYYKSDQKNERVFVSKLQQQYWLLKNSEYIVMRIEEIERQKKEAAAQAKAQAEEGAQS